MSTSPGEEEVKPICLWRVTEDSDSGDEVLVDCRGISRASCWLKCPSCGRPIKLPEWMS